MAKNDTNTFERSLNLFDIISIIRINLNWVFIIMFIGITYSIYYTYTIHPTYRATTKVILKEKPGESMVMTFGQNKENGMQNEIAIIKSRRLAKEVVKHFWNTDLRNSMALFGTRKFYPKGEKLRRFTREIFTLGLYDENSDVALKYNEPYTNEIGERFSKVLTENIIVKYYGNNDILEITYQTVFPSEAKKIVNVIATKFKELEKKIVNEDATLAVEFMEELVLSQEQNLITAEQKLKKFKIKNNIYSLDGSESQIVNSLSSLEDELFKTISDLNIKREEISYLSSKISNDEKNLATKIATDINAQVNSIRFEINELESELLKNNIVYGEKHTAVIDLSRRLELLKVKLNEKVDELISQGTIAQDPIEERQKIISDLISTESEIFSLISKRDETEKIIDSYEKKLLRLPDKQTEFAGLSRDIDVLTQNYLMLRQKLEEAKIELASKSGRVKILDIARRPMKPIKPNHNRDILTGIILSFFIAIAYIFIVEFFNNSIRSIPDIEHLKMTILGVIPATEQLINIEKSRFITNPFRKKYQHEIGERKLITIEDSGSHISEAYRSLRTNMIYNGIEKEVKSILISSAGPGEGKTTTVANMAVTYANLGKKTLLIDTDLRRPVVHKIFKLDKDPGITNYLVGMEKDIKGIIHDTDVNNLKIITSGVIPPNPSELLGSEKMIKLVNELEENWDIILFDSPPIIAVTDASMVSKAIDSIIIVVKVGHTQQEAFKQTINTLKNIKAPLTGLVLNAVKSSDRYGGYSYYYYYNNYNYSSNKAKVND